MIATIKHIPFSDEEHNSDLESSSSEESNLDKEDPDNQQQQKKRKIKKELEAWNTCSTAQLHKHNKTIRECDSSDNYQQKT